MRTKQSLRANIRAALVLKKTVLRESFEVLRYCQTLEKLGARAKGLAAVQK